MPKTVLHMPGTLDLGLMIFARILLLASLGLLPLILWQGWLWQAEFFAAAPPAAYRQAAVLPEVQASLDQDAQEFLEQGDQEFFALRDWLKREAANLRYRLEQEARGASQEDLAQALERIFPDLDRRAYYMLWQGTSVVSSPLNPELRDLDLGQLQDADGVRFIAELAALAEEGGGLTVFRLDASGPGQEARLHTGAPVFSESGQEAGLGAGPDGISGTFLAWAAPFKTGGVYLTVWRNAADASGEALYGFIPAWATGTAATQDRPGPLRGRLLIGLLLLQVSCLGLGLLLRYGFCW